MPDFRIVIEDARIELRCKTFAAESLEEAKRMAEADNSWTEVDGWNEYDISTSCEIREDQCVEVALGKEM